jgi:REP element-mobilizing transposase RayT
VDREDFLERLGEIPGRFAVGVHAFVLMDNHYHLLLRPENLNLSQAVQWLNVGFSIWFNKKHRRVGPLFQGRFKSVLIGEEEQLPEIIRYVHLNPVRIKRFGLDFLSRKKLEKGVGPSLSGNEVEAAIGYLREYRWSSYRAYAGLAACPTWLQPVKGKRMSGRHYRSYVEEGIRLGMPENPFEKNVIEGFLGDREGFEKLKKKLKIQGNQKEQKGVRPLEGLLPWERIVKAVEKMEGMSWEKICGSWGNAGRDLGLVLGRRYGGLSLKELGRRSGGMSYAAVAQALKRMESRAKEEKAVREKLLELVKMSTVET